MTAPRLRISPDAVFSVGRDGVHVALRGRSDGLLVSADVFALIARFAEPTEIEAVLADVTDVARTRQALDELADCRVLTIASAEPPDDLAQPAQRAVLTELDDLQMLLQRLVGDVHVLGPHAPLAALARSLGVVRADLLERQAELDLASERLTRRQLEAIDLGARRKLHVGSANRRLEGWINLDVHPAELCCNLARPLPFADRSIELVYSSHTFEHLAFPDEAYHLLTELRRVVKPGGVVRLVMPDFEALARAYVDGDTDVLVALAGGVAPAPWAEQLLAYSGAPVRTRDRWYDHKFGYDFTSLSAMLTRVGFTSVKRCAYMASVHPALRLDDRSTGATITIAGRSLSLFVEATP
jgi:predicted SAM-dependent methyltransferase